MGRLSAEKASFLFLRGAASAFPHLETCHLASVKKVGACYKIVFMMFQADCQASFSDSSLSGMMSRASCCCKNERIADFVMLQVKSDRRRMQL